MNDRTSAYRCKLSPPYNQGRIKIGGTKKDIEIVEQSRDGFTIRVPETLARKISKSKHNSLYYQGTAWSVSCKNVWVDEEGNNLVELSALEELAQGRSQEGNGFGGIAKLQSASAMDGTYAAVFLTVMTICILIMPAWGGKWGTSQIICDFVVQIWGALTSLIPGGGNLR